MAYVSSMNSEVIFTGAISRAPNAPYGKAVALVGLADSGDYYNPQYVGSMAEAKDYYTSGPLIQAYEEVTAAGAKVVYLTRIEDLSIQSFQRALDLLLECQVHIVVPLGIYYDDLDNYAQLFVDFCSDKGAYGECIAIMDIKPFASDAEITDQMINTRVSELFRNDRTAAGFGPDGRFLSVVMAEVIVFSGSTSRRIIPAGTIYAGLLTTLSPGFSPVNKPINKNFKLRYELKSSAIAKESLSIVAIPTELGRRPIEGTISVQTLDGSYTYMEGRDYSIDYKKGTITARTTATTPVSNPAIVSYVRDDYDTLASCGYVTFTEFVKNGISPATSVTMSSDTLNLVQDIRVMQSISSYIRDTWEALIGLCGPNLTNYKTSLVGYLNNLQSSNQIASYELNIYYGDLGRDLNVDVSIQTRPALMAQAFSIRLPVTI